MWETKLNTHTQQQTKLQFRTLNLYIFGQQTARQKILHRMIANIPWLQAALNFKISLPRSKQPTNWPKPDAEELTPHPHTVCFSDMFLISSSNLHLNFPTVPFLRGLPPKMFIFPKNYFFSKNIILLVQTTSGRYWVPSKINTDLSPWTQPFFFFFKFTWLSTLIHNFRNIHS
jgi:hypothetical protein